jgi:competence protein ComEA
VRLLFGQPLDLNHADSLALESLPGIGPRRASAILETRSRRPFRDTSDLVRVNGIVPKTLEKLEPWITVGDDLD